MRIGIDVGGTNTDAAVVDGDSVLASTKRATTPDISDGIGEALSDLARHHDPTDVDAVMIGTTHFVNALIQGRGLSATAAVRLGLPSTASLPPFIAWPPHTVEAISGRGYLCHGGHEFDGRPISRIDRGELSRVAEDIAARDIRSIAITSVFSPANADFELEAASIIASVIPDASITLSHEIGRMGLLERENATVINAALRDLADEVTEGLIDCLTRSGIAAPLFVSQNDGTLMDVEYARKYPVATFASGPTNSMRGAAFLSGEETCIVVDVGGTTTDVGVLHNGFPREATNEIVVAGIRTNFRMPDVLSIGLGGGSIVDTDTEGVSVGPVSVGYELTRRACVFGGGTLTATDLAVASGRADIGDKSLVASLDRRVVAQGMARIDELIQNAVDKVRTSSDPLPIVAVGGGAMLLKDEIEGSGSLKRPGSYAVANAVGAAIGQVSGEVDRIFAVGPGERAKVLEQARQEAVDRAVAAGASPSTVDIVDVEEVPIAYLPGNASRVRVKAVGDIMVRSPQGVGTLRGGHA
jgi:N-methylhydantoinase A/oxoprolinase/acetone carboxylase beta subunit